MGPKKATKLSKAQKAQVKALEKDAKAKKIYGLKPVILAMFNKSTGLQNCRHAAEFTEKMKSITEMNQKIVEKNRDFLQTILDQLQTILAFERHEFSTLLLSNTTFDKSVHRTKLMDDLEEKTQNYLKPFVTKNLLTPADKARIENLIFDDQDGLWKMNTEERFDEAVKEFRLKKHHFLLEESPEHKAFMDTLFADLKKIIMPLIQMKSTGSPGLSNDDECNVSTYLSNSTIECLKDLSFLLLISIFVCIHTSTYLPFRFQFPLPKSWSHLQIVNMSKNCINSSPSLTSSKDNWTCSIQTHTQMIIRFYLTSLKSYRNHYVYSEEKPVNVQLKSLK